MMIVLLYSDRCCFFLRRFAFFLSLTKVELSPIKWNKKCMRPGPEVIKLFSSSAQLSMKFQLLINAEIVKISGKFRFIPQNLVIYPANKC